MVAGLGLSASVTSRDEVGVSKSDEAFGPFGVDREDVRCTHTTLACKSNLSGDNRA